MTWSPLYRTGESQILNMNINKSYDNWAKSYDLSDNPTRDLDERITAEFLKGLQFNNTLEIGCGTGKNTCRLSEISKKVESLDFSEEMIKIAKDKVKLDNVNFSVGDITHLWPFKNHQFELITCNLVLEHINDLEFIFSEANRTLTNGGSFFISEFHPFRQYQGKMATFKKNGLQVEIQSFIHHVSDFLNASSLNGLILKELKEWWHPKDNNHPPRIISFWFQKSTQK